MNLMKKNDKRKLKSHTHSWHINFSNEQSLRSPVRYIIIAIIITLKLHLNNSTMNPPPDRNHSQVERRNVTFNSTIRPYRLIILFSFEWALLLGPILWKQLYQIPLICKSQAFAQFRAFHRWPTHSNGNSSENKWVSPCACALAQLFHRKVGPVVESAPTMISCELQTITLLS